MYQEEIQGFQVSPTQKYVLENGWEHRFPVRFSLLLEGQVEISDLEEAVAELTQRNEILRTIYHGTELPLQVILEEGPSWSKPIDLRLAENEREIEALLSASPSAEPNTPLHLLPVFLSAGRLLLIVNLLTPSVDASTPWLFAKNLCLLNEIDAEDTFQYADFAGYLNEKFEEAEVEQNYWRSIDIAAHKHTLLPYQSSGSDFQPAFFHIELSRASLQMLEQRQKREAFLMACWQVLLYRVTGESGLLVGTYFDGRYMEELADALGPLGQYLPIIALLDPNSSFETHLKCVEGSLEEAGAYQDQFTRDIPAANDSMNFGFEYRETESLRFKGASLCVSDNRIVTEPFAVRLICLYDQQRLITRFCYDASKLNRSGVEELARCFNALIASALRDPRVALTQLDLLTDEGQQQLLSEFNRNTDAKDESQDGRCIHQRFEEQVKRTPDSPAVSYEGQSLTFAALNCRANQFAFFLREQGVTPEQLVGICMERSVAALVGLLGVLKAGGAYLPLDPKNPLDRLQYIVQDSGAKMVMTKSGEKIFSTATCFSSEMDLSHRPRTNPDNTSRPENLAYAIYTSGTTGRPKAVLIAHGSPLVLLGAMKRLVYDNHPAGALRISMNAPLIFDAHVQQLIFLLEGHCLVPIPEDIRMDGEAMVDYLDRYAIDALDCTPAHLSVILAGGLLSRATKPPRQVMVAGGAINQSMWKELALAPATRFYNIYGPTEATVNATGLPIIDGKDTVTIGGPLAGYKIYLLNDCFKSVPPFLHAEICIGGQGLARGYLNRPAFTAQRFVPDPFSDVVGARLYKTGDLACFLDDGRLEFIGRVDHQVKLRGYRIELAEIEQVVLEHPGVEEAVAIVRSDEQHPDVQRLMVYFTAKAEATPERHEIRELLAKKLPEYMIPSVFVALEKMPLTVSGKLDRDALPESSRENESGQMDTPLTPVQEMLVDAWCEVLKLETVGLHDNYFDMGGHSLLTFQLVTRIRAIFQVEVDLFSFFGTLDIASQAELIEKLRQEGAGLDSPPLEKTSRTGPIRASYSQQRLWFAYQVQPGNRAYHVPVAFNVEGALNVSALEATLAAIIRRHDTLRTTFRMEDGNLFQIIHPFSTWSLPFTDLSDLPETVRDERLQSFSAKAIGLPFDLEKEGLIRVQAFRLSPQRHVVFCQLHHIVSDGWSIGVLTRELVSMYSTLCTGLPSTLAELPIQFADFSVWQRDWLSGDVFEKKLAFWREKLQGATPALSLPYKPNRPERASEAADYKTLSLSPELTRSLKALCRSEGLTLFMLTLTGFAVVTHHISGEEDIPIGTDLANRNPRETEDLIAFFINQLVLRTDLSGNPTLGELLLRVRAMSLESFLHQDMPFDRLVEALQPRRSAQLNAFFQIKFVFQNAPVHYLELPGLTLAPLDSFSGATKLDMMLSMWEAGDRLVGALEYKKDLFESRTMEAFIGHVERVLEQFVEKPQTRLADLCELLREEDDKRKKEKAVDLKKSRFSKFKKLIVH